MVCVAFDSEFKNVKIVILSSHRRRWLGFEKKSHSTTYRVNILLKWLCLNEVGHYSEIHY